MNTSFLSSLAWPIAIFSLAGLAYFLWRSWANEVGLRLNLQSYVAFRELLLDSMQEGFLAYDLEGHVKIVSESYTRISGWKAEEIIGSSGYERVAPGETPTLAELQARLIGHPNENLSLRYHLHCKDGQSLAVRSHLRFVPNGVPGYERPCVIALIRDISAEARAEEKLQANEALYESLVDNLHAAVMVVDLQMRILFVSKAMEQMSGYAANEMLGQPPERRISPEDMWKVRDNFKVVLRSGNVENIEVGLLRKDGALLHTRVNARYLAKGIPGIPQSCVLVVYEDISEAKLARTHLERSEKFYQSIVESLNEVVLIFDLKGVLRYVSPSLRRVLEFDPLHFDNDKLLDCIDPKDRKIFFDALIFQGGPRDGQGTRFLRFKAKGGLGVFREMEGEARYVSEGLRESREDAILLSFRDVEERVKAQEALSVNNRFHEALLENLHEAVLVTNMERKAVYVSPVVEKLLGYKPVEMLGFPPSRRVPPEDMPKLQGAFEKAVADGLPLYIEHHLFHKNGNKVPVRSLARFLPHGMPGYPDPCLMITYEDLSEAKAAGLKLEENNRFHEVLVNNLNEVVQVMDLKFNTRYISPVMERMLGYSPAEVLGLPPGDRIFPDDRFLLPIYFQQIQEARGEVVVANYRLIHKEGRIIHVEASCRLLPDGIPGFPEPCVLISYFDITKRKEAESKLESSERFYRALLENSLDGVSVISPDNKVLYHSPSIRRITGIDPEDRQGGSVFDNFPPHELPRIRGLLKELVSNPGKVVEAEVQSKNSKGDVRIFETVAQYHSEALGFPAIVVNFRDATERKRAQEQLLKFERLATVGELTAGLAHELRNPLLAMSLTSEMLLQDKGLSAIQRQDISVILEQCRRMKSLLEDALGAASERAHQARRLSAKGVLDTAANLARRQLESSGPAYAISVDLEPETLELMSEAGPLQQVMLNLVLNAIQAMPQGGSLVLEGRLDSGEVRLSVLDEGQGLPSSDPERIFEPFYTTKPNGSGLGLAICRRILKAQNGRITAERLKKGTAMRVWLPLAAPAELERPG